METVLFLATCINVADLHSLYFSYSDRFSVEEQQADDFETDLVELLLFQVDNDPIRYSQAMHDGFRAAMALDGPGLTAQQRECQTRR